METPVTLVPEIGMAFYLTIVVVVMTTGFKMFFQWVPWLWTNKIPGWVWAILAGVLSTVLCVVLRVDAIGKMFDVSDVAILRDNEWLSYIATGVAIGISSNVMYKVVTPIGKKLKDARGKVVCLPPGVALPPGAETTTTTTTTSATSESPASTVTETVVPSSAVVPLAQQPIPDGMAYPVVLNTDCAQLFLEMTLPDTPAHFVYADGKLYRVCSG